MVRVVQIVRNKEESGNVAKTAAKVVAEASWPQTRVILRVIIIVLIVAATLWVIIKLTGILLLLVLSVFFAYLVSPLVTFLSRPIRISRRRWVMPRVLAISLAYLIIVFAIVVAIYLLVPRLGNQFPEFAQQARGYWRSIGATTQRANEFLRLRMPPAVMDAVNRVGPALTERISLTLSTVVEHMLGWLAYIPWLILIPLLSFFFLKDAEDFRRSALRMLPRGRWRWRGDEFFQDVSETLAAYTRAQITACVFIGVICSIGFALLGLPSPLVLGFIAGVFEFVPLIGPLMIALLALIVAMLNQGAFWALMVLLFLGVLRVAQDYFIYPRLIGQGIHLHPLAVILAILSGAELAGVAGIFLAIPVVAILTVMYRHWLEHRGSEGIADVLEPTIAHPGASTTPEDMIRARPDLATSELKLPVE